MKYCTGDLQQYANITECMEFWRDLRAQTCVKYVLRGNSTQCRWTHLQARSPRAFDIMPLRDDGHHLASAAGRAEQAAVELLLFAAAVATLLAELGSCHAVAMRSGKQGTATVCCE